MESGTGITLQYDLGQVPARLWASFLASVKWRGQIEMVWGDPASCDLPGFFAAPLLPQEMTFKEKDTVRNINGKTQSQKSLFFKS